VKLKILGCKGPESRDKTIEILDEVENILQTFFDVKLENAEDNNDGATTTYELTTLPIDEEVNAYSSLLERLGIEKTCNVIRILLKRTDLSIAALGRAMLDTDPEALSDKVNWKEKYA
jgi:hypothetical protein